VVRPVVGQRESLLTCIQKQNGKRFKRVWARVALRNRKPVAWTGPIPKREEEQLLVTGTAYVDPVRFELERALIQSLVPRN